MSDPTPSTSISTSSATPTSISNPHQLQCPKCPSIIGLAGAATHVDKTIPLHSLTTSTSTLDPITSYWYFPTQFAFENIAVTHPVNAQRRMAAMAIKAERGYDADTSDITTTATTQTTTTTASTSSTDDTNVTAIATAVNDIDFKYLCCADCDYGPLGIVFKNEGTTTRGFYIAQQRVRNVGEEKSDKS